MSLSRIFIILFLVLVSGSAYAAESVTPFQGNIIDRLFAILPGSWDGRAIETPVGQVDYAIDFLKCDRSVVAGVAKLSVSDHYWRFWRSDGVLYLMFLSTFSNNRKPIRLIASNTEENTIRFHAPKLALLTLSVILVESHVDIRVFHHQNPHVYIRLTRSDRKINEIERVDSCLRTAFD